MPVLPFYWVEFLRSGTPADNDEVPKKWIRRWEGRGTK